MSSSGRGDDNEGTAVVYSWENVTAKSWENVEEDESGNIVTKNLYNADKERLKRAKMHRAMSNKCVRRGLIRYLIVCLDCSVHAKDTDHRPNRLESSKAAVERFMREYFDQNPISQAALALTRDRVAEKLTDLSGNSKAHIEMLRRISRASGAASLQNVLHLAIATLKHVPQYGSREILIVYSSLSSCDPGDIFNTIEEAKRVKIKCSVICLSAEVYICRRLAEETGGNFSVAQDMLHFSELLMQHTTPLPERAATSSKRARSEHNPEDESLADFIYMGFPSRTFDAFPMLAYDGTGAVVLTSTSFVCPRCGARVTEIPTKCSVCSLQLNSSSHIARSHHHLFPVPLFLEGSELLLAQEQEASALGNAANGAEHKRDVKAPRCGGHTRQGEQEHCFGCQVRLTTPLPADEAKSALLAAVLPPNRSQQAVGVTKDTAAGNKMALRCPRCHNSFCVECDIFIHDSLHNCPGCFILE